METTSGYGFEYVRQNLDGSAISTYVLVMLIVPLKLWCRLTGGMSNLGWDDALAVVSLIIANGFFFNTMIGVRPMLGHHITEFEIPQIIQFLKWVFAAQILYCTVIGSIKASLLAFLWRLFSVRSRVPLLAAAALVVAWTIAVNLLLILTCDPVDAQWDITIQNPTCLSRRMVYLGASGANVATDVILLILPIPYVWQLHAPLAQRIMLAGIFLLGCFVAIVSIIRLSIFVTLDLTSADVTYTLSMVFIWSIVEVNVGLICACLPSLRPAVKAVGLDRLFRSAGASEGTPRPSNRIEPSARSGSGDAFRSSSKKRDIFSTLTRTGDWDEEEDSFQMIRQHNEAHGKTDTDIGIARSSTDTDEQQRPIPTSAPAIRVHRNWQISENHAPTHGRT